MAVGQPRLTVAPPGKVLGVLAAVLVVARWSGALRRSGTFQDLRVYRDGATALLAGLSPYGERGQGHGVLVFTYPPFAALGFAPLSWMPWWLACLALLAASAGAYVGLIWLTGAKLGWGRTQLVSVMVLGLLAEPVVRTVQQGQINLVLALLVVVDLWVLPTRWRGVLLGVAAGIKIVPAVFVLALVVRREWPAVVRTVLAGAGTVVVAWWANPTASLGYWTRLFLDTSRSGGGGYPDNQSIVGVVARLVHSDHPAILLTLPLQAGVLALGYWTARRAHQAGRPVESVVAIALAGLLASPVSWSHHWIWCIPLVVCLVDRQRVGAAIGTAAIFLVPPLAVSPLGGLTDAPRAVWVTMTALFPAAGLYHLTRLVPVHRTSVEGPADPNIVADHKSVLGDTAPA